MEASKPILTEPGVKYFLNETLKQCRDFKNKYNNTLFNISLFTGFMFLLGTILLFKYKGKMTFEEKENREREKQYYILSKIKNYQESRERAQQGLITGLPQWNDEYASLHHK